MMSAIIQEATRTSGRYGEDLRLQMWRTPATHDGVHADADVVDRLIAAVISPPFTIIRMHGIHTIMNEICRHH